MAVKSNGLVAKEQKDQTSTTRPAPVRYKPVKVAFVHGMTAIIRCTRITTKSGKPMLFSDVTIDAELSELRSTFGSEIDGNSTLVRGFATFINEAKNGDLYPDTMMPSHVDSDGQRRNGINGELFDLMIASVNGVVKDIIDGKGIPETDQAHSRSEATTAEVRAEFIDRMNDAYISVALDMASKHGVHINPWSDQFKRSMNDYWIAIHQKEVHSSGEEEDSLRS